VPEWADGIVRIALFKIKGSDPISIAREKSNALTDLILMGVVFWSVWSLRFIGATFVGALTMGAGMVLVLILQRWRGKPLSDIGIQSVASLRWLVSHTGQAMMYIGLTMLVVGGLRICCDHPATARILVFPAGRNADHLGPDWLW
jgi:hypothetical protein